MAKKQEKQHKMALNYRWVKVLRSHGGARMEKREVVDGVQTGRVLATRKC